MSKYRTLVKQIRNGHTHLGNCRALGTTISPTRSLSRFQKGEYACTHLGYSSSSLPTVASCSGVLVGAKRGVTA